MKQSDITPEVIRLSKEIMSKVSDCCIHEKDLHCILEGSHCISRYLRDVCPKYRPCTPVESGRIEEEEEG